MPEPTPDPPVPDSIAFDRAASYYDETRGLPDDVQAEVTRVLAAELAGIQGRCLEVGVGTGRIALPLHRAGVAMAGADLSVPMMERLVAKAGGDGPPFPLVQADGSRLPFPDSSFGAAMVVHVLHLVRQWEDVVRELVRVVGSGGRLLVNLGGAHGIEREVTDKLRELAPAANRIGLTEPGPLDELMASLGAEPGRELERVEIPRNVAPIDRVEHFASNKYSGTWRLSDEERTRAVEELRRWVFEHWGDPEMEQPDPVPIVFRAYDL